VGGLKVHQPGSGVGEKEEGEGGRRMEGRRGKEEEQEGRERRRMEEGYKYRMWYI